MKTAMITGVAGGIGGACAGAFLKNGFAVVGMDVAEKAPEFGDDFTYLRGDLSSREDRASFLALALEKHGRVDVLLNVAGVAPKVRRDVLEMTEESYDFVMGINTKGTFFLTQSVANEMIKAGRGGAIVNVSSMSAYTSSTSRGEYCISKAGVSMITALFADRLAEYGIAVNEVRPGIIMTGMTDAVKDKYDKLIGEGLLPVARWGKPEDVAAAMLALADGSLPYVTGQSVDVDGGFHIRRL
ncbi:MAG: 3-ketoacyl-ACP reductase [Clostridia bacterium]|nr:3-ketoacyl-ACP reductase [Clostridia bacterium]